MTAIEPPIGYVRLYDAVDAVGQKMKGSRWRPVERIAGPYSVLSREQNPDFDEVITTIAKQFEAGKIATAYRTTTGSTEKLNRRAWQRPQWRSYFAAGTIELDLPLIDVNGRPNADGHTARCTHEILVRQKDLDRFIGTLPKAKRPLKAETARVSDVQIRKTVEQYLATTAAPSLDRLDQYIKNIPLNIPRSRLWPEYRKQRPNLRRGRPSNNPPK